MDTPMNVSRDDLDALLHRFGHTQFRPGQKRVIRDLLDGRDVMAVLPTGAGKSLVFQLAAQLLPGVTIVVSPLLALMKDQVESLENVDIKACFVNSTQSQGEARRKLEEVIGREARLLYVTPERFGNADFMDAVRTLDVSLFVVDEAHCLSEWGHDFRPAYLGLGHVIAELGHPATLALTATATPWVRREIVDRLGMRDPDIVVRGIDRPNLFLEVIRVEDESDDYAALRRLFTGGGRTYSPGLQTRIDASMQGCGIIYTATTQDARETALWLNEWGISADYYHGQRKKADRARVQEGFMNGDIRVICATNAFGLGVDKPDVRFVIHRDVPGSVEAYYQEAGRAGRDGAFSRCVLIYRPADLGRAAFFGATGTLDVQDIERVRFHLLQSPRTSMRKLSESTGLKNGHLARVIELLKDEEIITVTRGRVWMTRDDFNPQEISLEREEQRRAYERSRVEMMRGYAELTDDCRREYILNYFGQEYEQDVCGMCDNDVRQPNEVEGHRERDTKVVASARGFQMGDAVVHDAWGTGEVQRVTTETITVLFAEAGYKTLAADLVRDDGLLVKVT
jgi:ATP-dependent DNA helicase RecQ